MLVLPQPLEPRKPKISPANGEADLVDGGEIAKAQRQVVRFDGDRAVIGRAWWDAQWRVLGRACALEVGKRVVQLAAGRNGAKRLAGARGNQPAAIEHQAVFELFGLLHVGGSYQQRQLRALRAYLLDQLPEAPPRQRVDARRRFIEDQQVRLVDQGTAQAQFLFHAPRQLAGQALGEALQVGGMQQAGHALFAFAAAKAKQRGEKANVLADRQFGIKVVAQPLRHECHFWVQRGAVATLPDGAAQHLQFALLQALHAGDQPEQGRFTGPVRADQCAACARRQAEPQRVQGDQIAIAVADTFGQQRWRVHCRLAGQSTSAVRT